VRRRNDVSQVFKIKGIEGRGVREMSVDRTVIQAGKKYRRESEGDPATNWII